MLEFMKSLFGEDGKAALTYDELEAAARGAKLNVADLSGGSYVSREKFDSKVNSLNTQITTLQGQIDQRDKDMSTLRDTLTAAQADAGKLAGVQQELSGLQSKYATDKDAFEKQLSQQAYEFAVKERANGLKFTSKAAKEAYIRKAIEKQFKMDGENLLGYSDFEKQYRTDDPGAFMADEPAPAPTPTTPPPTITVPGHNPAPHNKRMSLTAMMKAKNDNPDMKISFE